MDIALCGFYAKKNFGDDLMQYHLSEVLSESHTHNLTIFSDTSSYDVHNGLEDNSFLMCDHIVVGGGNIISKDFWLFKNDGIQRLIDSKKKVHFVNVATTSDLTEDLAKKLKLLNANWWVRSKESIDILKNFEIDSKFLPDISFSNHVLAFRNFQTTKKLSVFLNSYAFDDLFKNHDVTNFINSLRNSKIIAEFCDWMTCYDWEITFYAAHTVPEFDDRIVSGFVYGMTVNKNLINWDVKCHSFEEIIECIANSDLVLSMRYHSTVLALRMNIPCIDITHHDKNKSLLDDIDLRNISVRFNNLDKNSLISIAQYVENSEDYHNKINIYKKHAFDCWDNFNKEWNTIMRAK